MCIYDINSFLNAILDDSISNNYVIEIWWIFEDDELKIWRFIVAWLKLLHDYWALFMSLTKFILHLMLDSHATVSVMQ